MRNRWKIATLLMAIVVVGLTITIISRDDSEVIYNAIMTRSSVRSYTTQPIEQEMIEKLLRAGMAAPSGGNKQPWEFVVITDREVLDQIPGILRGGKMATQAPLAIAVLGSPSKAMYPEYWIQDGSAATENILLAAHGMGLGAVWCGVYPDDGSGRFERINQLLSLPDGTYTLSLICIGYPDSEPTIKDKWNSSKIHYNRYK